MNTLSIEDEIDALVARVASGLDVSGVGETKMCQPRFRVQKSARQPARRLGRRERHRLKMQRYRQEQRQHYRMLNAMHQKAWRERQKQLAEQIA